MVGNEGIHYNQDSFIVRIHGISRLKLKGLTVTGGSSDVLQTFQAIDGRWICMRI